MYFAPRFAYAHSSSESHSNLLPGNSTIESSSNSWQVGGWFGAQYWFGSRFSVFGEAGLTRSSVAAVFYF